MIYSVLEQLCADLAGDPDKTRYAGKYASNINLAQQQWAVDSMALVEDESLSFASGVSTYALPSDFIVEESVILNGLPLKPISRHTLAILYPGTDWTTLQGTPTHFMIDSELANKKVRVIPIPQSTLTGSLRYYPLPVDVSAAADVPLNASTLMTRFHMGIAGLAAWLMTIPDAGNPGMPDRRKAAMTLYNDSVSKAIETFGNTKSEGMRFRPK